MICPACIANAAVMVAGVTSSGGVTALIISRFRKIIRFRKPDLKLQAKEKLS